MGYLGKTTSANLPGRGLINPAFIIKIVAATDIMQQQPSSGRDNPNNDYLDNLKVGSTIKAKIKGRTIIGSVQRTIKNEIGDVTYVIVADKKGKVHKIGSTLVNNVGNPTLADDRSKITSSPAIFNENKFFSYQQFKTMYE